MSRSLAPCPPSSTSPRARRRLHLTFAAATVGLGALCAAPSTARADDVSSTGRGIVGGALLGGEVVVIVEAIAGVRTEWPYIVGGLVGAVGGGIGGHFIEQSSSDGRVPAYMIAGGLALIIPALVLTLNATRYHASEGAIEDAAPTNQPAADPGRAGGSAVEGGGTGGAATPRTDTRGPAQPATNPGPPHVPLTLIDVHGGALRLGLPVPEMRQMWSTAQQKDLGVKQGAEVRMPLMRVSF